MKAAPFEYVAAQSTTDLIEILASGDGDTAILAGGQSLIPQLALRERTPTRVVDINPLVSELGVIETAGGGVKLGALVRQRTAERSPEVAGHLPLLAEALPLCAKPAIRTRGTVCGSLAHADPAAEIPLVALVHDAEIRVTGPRGERTIAVEEFFTGPFESALADDEALTEVSFPDLPPTSGTCFVEISWRHADRAIVAAAVAVQLDGSRIADARIALGNVAPTPVRATQAEAALTGETWSADTAARVAAAVSADIDPASDVHASAAYRRHVAGVLVRRAVTTSIDRAGRTL